MLADPGKAEAQSDVPEAPIKARAMARRDQVSNPPALPEKSSQTQRRRWRRPVLILLLPLALIGAGYRCFTGGQTISTDNAYIEADKVGITTDISGIVREVDVAENQHVAAGQVLYRLDDSPFQIALRRAEARIGIIKNDLNALRANYEDMQARIGQARNDIDYYTTEFHRQQNLLASHVASQSAFDVARRDLENARQKAASLTQQLAAIAANLSGDPNIPVERQPRYLDALAERDEAARQLRHTVIQAPFAGVVTEVPSIAPGKYLPAATVAFYLVATDRVWVDSNPKETELTYVRPGQRATVTVDTYPGHVWKGTVESVSPAASQEFSLLPAQNTSGNWVKVVQRIPMRVRIDTSEKDRPPLHAGMSVVVDVDTGHRRGLRSSQTCSASHRRRDA